MIGTFAHVHNGGTVGLEARQGTRFRCSDEGIFKV